MPLPNFAATQITSVQKFVHHFPGFLILCSFYSLLSINIQIADIKLRLVYSGILVAARLGILSAFAITL